MPPPIPTGFDGLSSFVTDADTAIAEADRIAAGPRSTPAPRQRSGPPMEPVDRDGGAFLGGIKKVGGWVLGIGLILAIKTCFFAGTHAAFDGSSSSSYDQSTAPQGYSVFSGDDTDATDVTSVDNMTADDTTVPVDGADGGAVGDAGSSNDGYLGGGVDAVPEPEAGPSDESRPLPGMAVLSMAEMQYCLAEDITLSGQKSEMDSLQYSDPDRFDRNVDDFNSAVSDYNSVCSNRQIVSSQRPLAEMHVNGRSAALETEGRARVQ